MSFNELGLSPHILRAVKELGYEQPTPIQQQAIPAILAGQDVLGGAQTGTGKTAGFTLPMLHRLLANHGRGGRRQLVRSALRRCIGNRGRRPGRSAGDAAGRARGESLEELVRTRLNMSRKKLRK